MKTFGGLSRQDLRKWLVGHALPPADMMVVAQELFEELERAEQERDAAIADEQAVRALMNCYNLGGWTDAESAMKRALSAERERDEIREDYLRRHKDAVDYLERAVMAERERDANRAQLDAWRTAVEDEENCDLFEDGVAGDLRAVGIRTLTGAWMDGRAGVLRSIRERVAAAIDAHRKTEE